MKEIFYFLGAKIVSHPASKKTGSAELYKEWEFPEQYEHLNHPTWKNLKLEEDWNFIHLVYEHITDLKRRYFHPAFDANYGLDKAYVQLQECILTQFPKTCYFELDKFISLFNSINKNLQ